MKIHGSIEASISHSRFPLHREVSMNENSWLYWSQEFYGIGLCPCKRVSMNENSWLYWSLTQTCVEVLFIDCVSMNENSWLYWSCIWSGCSVLSMSSFHEWKFMALLKLMPHALNSPNYPKFPWMKIHGSIEAFHPAALPIPLSLVSMNENSWLY